MTFKIYEEDGSARIGELRINGKKLETPYLFPVLPFFCGGVQRSSFGGGIYRNIKEEFLTNSEFQEYFSGVMTSIAQINDFKVSKEKLEKLYLSKTVSKWFNFHGMLFVDSGGFKLLTNGKIKGRDFEIKKPEEILRYQKKFGADIITSLDHPISPDISSKEREKRIRFSIKNAVYLLANKPKNTLAYLAIHGYSRKELHYFLSQLMKGIESENIPLKSIDGIGIGSLVPLRSNFVKIVEIVNECKKLLSEFNLSSLPVHVFGISSSLLPILIFLGIDTFDSASYVYAALNGVYYKDGLRRQHIGSVDFKKCYCKVCRDKNFLKRLESVRKLSNRDNMAPLAIHNLIMQQKEIKRLKEAIKNGDTNLHIYLQKTFGKMRCVGKIIKQINGG